MQVRGDCPCDITPRGAALSLHSSVTSLGYTMLSFVLLAVAVSAASAGQVGYALHTSCKADWYVGKRADVDDNILPADNAETWRS